ncbi:hypothetical protein DFP73DRAFT_518632 [Morchella snyderi]|nr:hypothetical protein DFP73DRAFT_518632 [Morchella snyderi]
MEDDWASPWADADDRDPAEVISIPDAKDAKDARSAGSAGTNIPQPRIPNNNVVVHDDPWSTEEPEFRDSSAWATSSPADGSGIVLGVIGGSGLPEWVEPASVGVPEFVVKRATEERLPTASGGSVQRPEAKKNGDWFGATDEADAWAAGSDWGDIKHEGVNETNTSRESPPGVVPETKHLSSSDELIGGVNGKGSVYVDKQEDNIDAPDNNKQIGIEIEKRGNEGTIAPDIAPIEAPFTSETIALTESTSKIEKEPEGGSNTQEVTKGEEEDDDDDDFGDFANEGDFEDVEKSPTKDIPEESPPLPQTPHFKVDTPFNIDTSLLNKLYPIFTSYPEPPPIKEIIYSTNSRKAWYRLSQSGTIRKDKSGDDDYVRVTWVGSKIQEDVNKIVSRWMVEDKSSGGGVALGGSQRLGAMFGWGEGVEPVEKKTLPVRWNTVNTHSRHSSLVVGKTTGQGLTKPPFDISTTKTSPPESQTAPSSPLVASFGWNSFDNSQPIIESQPNSSSNSVKGDEKLPSTPYRASFQSTPSRMSSQPVTPSRSVVSHSPVASNHSSKPSHSLATTRPSSPSPQSTQRTVEATATTPIVPASMDSLFSSNSGVSMSGEQPKSTSVPVPSTSFDEWGAFENIATTVKLPSNIEANCNFDEWGAFENTNKAAESKPSGSVSGQGRTSSLSMSTKSSAPPLGLAHVSDEPSSKATEASGPKTSGTDNWGFDAFESTLTPKPKVPSQLLGNPPTYAIHNRTSSVGKTQPKTLKVDPWGSFDAFEVSKPSEVSKSKATNSLPRLEPRSSGSGRITTASHIIPAISKLAINDDDDDDDDWGEMVQSPVVPKGSSPFSNALPSPLNPSLRTISPAPFQNAQTQPKASTVPSAQSTASMFDFSSFEKSSAPQKKSSNNTASNGNGGNDTWDLSFFDGSVSTTAATPVNVSAPAPFSNQATTTTTTTTTTGSTDLWDAPPPSVTGRRENAKEAEESRLVYGVVDGLPDLSYMLQ